MRIVVLNDGTTWTNIEGCVITTVADDFNGELGDLPALPIDTIPVYDGDVETDNDGQLILYTGIYEEQA